MKSGFYWKKDGGLVVKIKDRSWCINEPSEFIDILSNHRVVYLWTWESSDTEKVKKTIVPHGVWEW